MKIALIQGGMSSERDVSLNTGRAFEEALLNLGYPYVVIDAGPDLPVRLWETKPTVALLALHGKYAEDGTVQGLCEYMRIPYTGAGVMASALCMNKYYSKKIFSFHGIPTPDFEFFDLKKVNPSHVRLQRLRFPVVVKPSRDGSTMGITIARNEQELKTGFVEALKYDHEVLVEDFIPGSEITVPVLDDKVLTPIEIVPQEGFYDYQRKYTAGKTEYILPPRLDPKITDQVKELALQTHQACQVRVYSRVDFRVKPDGSAFVLEINTLPGCTKTSLLPKSAAHDGVEFTRVIQILIERATLDYEGAR